MNNEEKILALLEQLQTGQQVTITRLDGIDQRLDGIDQRLDGIDQRLDAMDERFDAMDERFDTLEGKVNALTKDVTHLNQFVEPAIKTMQEGIEGIKEHNQYLVRLVNQVDDHDHRIWALEQAAKAQ